MSNKVYKNYQINQSVTPFQVKPLFNYQNIKTIDVFKQENTDTEENSDISENAEDVLKSAKDEAELILQEAKYEADRIINNTQAETEENKNRLYEEAQQNGYNEGYSQGMKQYEELISEAEQIRETAKLEYKETLDNIENDAIELILDIAKNVIGTEFSFNKEDILYLVKEAFEKCANKETVLLKAAPEDYDFIIANKQQLLSMIEGVGELKIKKDNSLKTGACIVETQYGSIDAGIQTKINKIEELFRQMIGKS